MGSNPVIVIATDKRIKITTANIKTLAGRTVVVVVSSRSEYNYYSKITPYVVYADNKPLGTKWQAGVDYARTLPHSHIIITGSDDILSVDFINKAIAAGCDLFALNHWYITDFHKLWLFKYMAYLPLGGGRCYSKQFCEKIDYQLFYKSKNKLLDNHGWNQASGAKIVISPDPDILAVKGNWPVMNPLQKTFGHPNAKLIQEFNEVESKIIMKEKFNYEC